MLVRAVFGGVLGAAPVVAVFVFTPGIAAIGYDGASMPWTLWASLGALIGAHLRTSAQHLGMCSSRFGRVFYGLVLLVLVGLHAMIVYDVVGRVSDWYAEPAWLHPADSVSLRVGAGDGVPEFVCDIWQPPARRAVLVLARLRASGAPGRAHVRHMQLDRAAWQTLLRDLASRGVWDLPSGSCDLTRRPQPRCFGVRICLQERVHRARWFAATTASQEAMAAWMMHPGSLPGRLRAQLLADARGSGKAQATWRERSLLSPWFEE